MPLYPYKTHAISFLMLPKAIFLIYNNIPPTILLDIASLVFKKYL